MSAALLSSGFAIRPWIRALLLCDDFYAESIRSGLVRKTIDFVVALMTATSVDATRGGQLEMMEKAGQFPLYLLSVSGWKPNGYNINTSAMDARTRIAQGFLWRMQ